MPDIEESIEAARESVVASAQHELVVLESFLGHVKGDVISEAEKVSALLESEWVSHFVKRPKAA